MSTYNTDLQTNNTSLEEILETINNLPEESDGVDTSDATATASHILSGKTAYVKGTKITGNIASQAAKTIIPTTTPQVAVLSGRYTAGAITVQGDSNLKAENIAEGVSIFGVTGTHSGGGSGGGSIETCTFTLARNSAYVGEATALCFTDYDKTNNTFIPRAFSEGSFSEVNIDSSEILRDGQWTVICGSIIWISVAGGSNINITGTDECNILINELSLSYLSSKVICIQAPLTADTNFTITLS